MDPENDNESRPQRKSEPRWFITSYLHPRSFKSHIIKENYHRSDFPRKLCKFTIGFARTTMFQVNGKGMTSSMTQPLMLLIDDYVMEVGTYTIYLSECLFSWELSLGEKCRYLTIFFKSGKSSEELVFNDIYLWSVNTFTFKKCYRVNA